jgi:hypothetical protein
LLLGLSFQISACYRKSLIQLSTVVQIPEVALTTEGNLDHHYILISMQFYLDKQESEYGLIKHTPRKALMHGEVKNQYSIW